MPVALAPTTPGLVTGRTCAICQDAIGKEEAAGLCPECSSPFHVECWDEIGGCATYGCKAMPEAEKEEVPAFARAHWGSETKECARCRRRIRVAALRCRHCGLVFTSAEPTTAAPGRSRATGRTTFLRALSLTVFVAGLLPCASPLVLLPGIVWFLFHRRELRRTSVQHHALYVIGLIASGIITLVMVGGLSLATISSLLGN